MKLVSKSESSIVKNATKIEKLQIKNIRDQPHVSYKEKKTLKILTFKRQIKKEPIALITAFESLRVTNVGSSKKYHGCQHCEYDIPNLLFSSEWYFT